MYFFSSKSATIKIAATLLIVACASIGMAICSLTTARQLYQNASQKYTPALLPTFSPTPTACPTTLQPTPTPTITPTSTTTPAPTNSANPTPTPSPALATQETVRDSTMNYIQTNHPETAQFMTNLIWTGGRATQNNLVGAETYMYYSQGWNATITYPVYPNPIYKITADYSTTSNGIPYRITWIGTWQNDIINETSYVFAQ